MTMEDRVRHALQGEAAAAPRRDPDPDRLDSPRRAWPPALVAGGAAAVIAVVVLVPALLFGSSGPSGIDDTVPGAAGGAATTVTTVTTVGGDDGEAWRLLDFTRSGPTYSVFYALNEGEAAYIWERLQIEVPLPEVDYQEEILIGLGHAVSGSCPEIEFAGLVIEDDRVYGEFEFPAPAGLCTDDANSALFLVAVERRALPSRFTLSLTAEEICGGCPEDTVPVFLDDFTVSQWWQTARLVIAVAGAPPEDVHVVRWTGGGFSESVLALPRAEWVEEPHWLMLFDADLPARVEGYTADCLDGECIEDQELLEATGPVCSVEVAVAERQGKTVMITFAPDGTCTIELIDGIAILSR